MDKKPNGQSFNVLAAAIMISLAVFAWWAINPSSRYKNDLEATYNRVNPEQLEAERRAEEPEGPTWKKEIR